MHTTNVQTCMNFFTLTEFKTEMWEKGCILLLIARLNFLFETSFHLSFLQVMLFISTLTVQSVIILQKIETNYLMRIQCA